MGQPRILDARAPGALRRPALLVSIEKQIPVSYPRLIQSLTQADLPGPPASVDAGAKDIQQAAEKRQRISDLAEAPERSLCLENLQVSQANYTTAKYFFF